MTQSIAQEIAGYDCDLLDVIEEALDRHHAQYEQAALELRRNGQHDRADDLMATVTPNIFNTDSFPVKVRNLCKRELGSMRREAINTERNAA